MDSMLTFEDVSKRFGKTRAVDGLSLELRRGEILGFLGPNGAGKTTAMHLAMGFVQPTSGRGTLLGQPFGYAAARARVGFAPDAPVFFGGNAVETLALAARLSGRRPEPGVIDRVLRQVGIEDRRRDVRKFSRGMQQRLGLAVALVHDPELLILDEPAAALDPPGVAEIRAVLLGLRQEGKTILLSSHQLAEVEHLCDRIAFLREGRLLYCGALREALRGNDEVEVVVRGLPAQAGLRRALASRELPSPQEGETRWALPAKQQRWAIEQAWAEGADLVSVRARERSLTELFAAWAHGEVDPAPVIGGRADGNAAEGGRR
jgi:ABC-2 type transport system ATP-binding protein